MFVLCIYGKNKIYLDFKLIVRKFKTRDIG